MMLWSFSQVGATMLCPGMRASLIFNAQHVATGWPNARNILRPTMLGYVTLMLRSFGRGLKYSKVCVDLLGAYHLSE